MFDTQMELFQATLALFPNASIGEDSEGQVIIYTGLVCSGDEDEPVVPIC